MFGLTNERKRKFVRKKSFLKEEIILYQIKRKDKEKIKKIKKEFQSGFVKVIPHILLDLCSHIKVIFEY